MKHTAIIKKALTMGLAMLFLFTTAGAVALTESTVPAYTQELRSGDQEEAVQALQQRLYELGYYQGARDGSFNAQTLQALILFQQQNNLLATGTLDATTHAVLYSAAALPFAPVMVDATYESASRMMPASMMAGTAPYAPVAPFNTNEYNAFQDNRFLSVLTSPLSTFAADVDTASYAQLRRMILAGTAVPMDAVRIEEMLNYFQYSYQQPVGDEPLGVTMELGVTPWNPDTWLLQIGLQAKEIPQEERPRQNLVFLIDVSGSMDMPDKLPLVKRSFQLLLEELHPEDTISIVTYASRDEVVLDGMRAGDKTTILDKVDSLTAGGMTAGAAGINTAYALAAKHFIKGGNNRVLLATDGDLNLGISDEGSLARLVEEKKQGGIYLSVLGFGDGNYKDNKLEALADWGDGNYSYIDTVYEARKALVTEIGATFFAVAKNVKLQVDFNPAFIKGYRLIGYENRLLEAEDFADDTVDGGELGSGHRMTALYELVPVGSAYEFGETGSKDQAPATPENDEDEMLTLSIRAMAPDGDKSSLYTYPLKAQEPAALSDNLKFAAAVAQTGMLLRSSPLKGTATYASTLQLLRDSQSITGDPYKEEFLYLVTLLDRQGEVQP